MKQARKSRRSSVTSRRRILGGAGAAGRLSPRRLVGVPAGTRRRVSAERGPKRGVTGDGTGLTPAGTGAGAKRSARRRATARTMTPDTNEATPNTVNRVRAPYPPTMCGPYCRWWPPGRPAGASCRRRSHSPVTARSSPKSSLRRQARAPVWASVSPRTCAGPGELPLEPVAAGMVTAAGPVKVVVVVVVGHVAVVDVVDVDVEAETVGHGLTVVLVVAVPAGAVVLVVDDDVVVPAVPAAAFSWAITALVPSSRGGGRAA